MAGTDGLRHGHRGQGRGFRSADHPGAGRHGHHDVQSAARHRGDRNRRLHGVRPDGHHLRAGRWNADRPGADRHLAVRHLAVRHGNRRVAGRPAPRSAARHRDDQSRRLHAGHPGVGRPDAGRPDAGRHPAVRPGNHRGAGRHGPQSAVRHRNDQSRRRLRAGLDGVHPDAGRPDAGRHADHRVAGRPAPRSAVRPTGRAGGHRRERKNGRRHHGCHRVCLGGLPHRHPRNGQRVPALPAGS